MAHRPHKSSAMLPPPPPPVFRGTTRYTTPALQMQENLKPAKMVSVSSVLKRKPMKELYVPAYKLKKARPEHPLYVEYKECIETSRATLRAEATAELEDAYKSLLQDVEKIKLDNQKTVTSVKTKIEAVMAPLGDELITLTSANGEKTEIKLSDQISAFKALLTEEEEKLKTKWANWESIQQELAVLGMQVLGEKGMVEGVEVKGRVEDGFNMDLERWGRELRDALRGPVRDVERAGEEALAALEEMEKDLDQKFKVQKAKVIAMITEDD